MKETKMNNRKETKKNNRKESIGINANGDYFSIREEEVEAWAQCLASFATGEDDYKIELFAPISTEYGTLYNMIMYTMSLDEDGDEVTNSRILGEGSFRIPTGICNKIIELVEQNA